MIPQITQYFHDLSEEQVSRLAELEALYREWNARINVISRKDIGNLVERHVLHSLAIARFVRFNDGETVMDAGTGGGFPGIPLAILFPGVRFTLLDSTAKKLKVVEAVAGELGLDNVLTVHSRLEDHHKKYDYVVSRAVADLQKFYPWVKDNLTPGGNRQKGLWYLKGGEVEDELTNIGGIEHEIFSLSSLFSGDFFITKKLIHIIRYR